MNTNFKTALDFVWRQDFDSPAQGFHCTEGDPGKGTFGGVIEETWDSCVRAGIVKGRLVDAGPDQLSSVLRAVCWGASCDALPPGLDLLMFNGAMMTGQFKRLFQQCLGFMGPDACDGSIGPVTLDAVKDSDPVTLIHAVTGVHYAYLSTRDTWVRFGHGWTNRLKAARDAALALARPVTA